jgi:signal transduction histidine kinase
VSFIRLTNLIRCLCLGLLIGENQGSSAEPLTNAAAILTLTSAQAAQALPVVLQGVVTAEAEPTQQALVIQDATAGVYVLAPTSLFAAVHRGELLEVTGVTDPGEFAPIVKVKQFRRLGKGVIPPPQKVSYAELLSGHQDAQWVEITGVIHDLEPLKSALNQGKWKLTLGVGDRKLLVSLEGPRLPVNAVDAEVRIQALCFYQFTQTRHLLSPLLSIPRGCEVEILHPGPAAPFKEPVHPLSSLLEYSPDDAFGHRLHVRGTVIHQEPGQGIWIQEGKWGARIQTAQTDQLASGDQIDVLGFPVYDSHEPILEDCVFHKLSSGPKPVPVPLHSPREAFDHEDNLVSVEGIVVDIEPTGDSWVYSFENTGRKFKGILKRPERMRTDLLDWQIGSRVRATGICLINYENPRPLVGGIWQPQSFEILMRGPEDLAVIDPAPWWTPEHGMQVLAWLSGVLALTIGVVFWISRQRLQDQSRRRAMAEAEFSAILAERNRLAREIHDTLAQGLTATSVQLQLAKKHAGDTAAPVQHHLSLALELVRGSLTEARQSIWNMRAQILETNDLPGALAGILKQITDGTPIRTDFRLSGQPQRLSPVIENNLLRIAQEAVTNATKYANARLIRLTIDFTATELHLLVADDGQGFDPIPKKPGATRNGFGLLGMQERAKELKGVLNIESVPGQGTQVRLTLPLSADSPAE